MFKPKEAAKCWVRVLVGFDEVIVSEELVEALLALFVMIELSDHHIFGWEPVIFKEHHEGLAFTNGITSPTS